jgi:hypothetical protein
VVPDDPTVRTTLDIDDDVLQAVKELAEVRGLTAGQTLSALVRQALKPAAFRQGAAADDEARQRAPRCDVRRPALRHRQEVIAPLDTA